MARTILIVIRMVRIGLRKDGLGLWMIKTVHHSLARMVTKTNIHKVFVNVFQNLDFVEN